MNTKKKKILSIYVRIGCVFKDELWWSAFPVTLPFSHLCVHSPFNFLGQFILLCVLILCTAIQDDLNNKLHNATDKEAKALKKNLEDFAGAVITRQGRSVRNSLADIHALIDVHKSTSYVQKSDLFSQILDNFNVSELVLLWTCLQSRCLPKHVVK